MFSKQDKSNEKRNKFECYEFKIIITVRLSVKPDGYDENVTCERFIISELL